MMARILILDDDIVPYDPRGDELPGYMAYYEQELRDAGHDVAGINDVCKGMAKVASEQFDLAIIDLMMPPKTEFGLEETDSGLRTGVVVATRIHALHPGMPLIFLSNVNMDGANASSIRQLVDEGWVKRYCFKPVTTPVALAYIVANELEKVQ